MNSMFTQGQGFGIEGLLDIIQRTLYETVGNPPNDHTYMMNPGDLPGPNEPFEFQYGFTLTPTDLQGTPIGPGVTITENMNYEQNNIHLYNQIQESVQRYQQIFEHLQANGDAQPPWINDDGGSPPNSIPECPWDEQSQNCNQQ